MATADDLKGHILVGIDSGGTRTNARIEVQHGDEAPVARTYETRDNLSGALPIDRVPSTIRSILALLEPHVDQHSDGSLPVFIWISAAGFTPWTRESYAAALHDLAPKVLGGSVKIIGAANDAVSQLLGSGADGVIIAGTGSNVIVRARDGHLSQTGGHEWVGCDYGSGFWIGLRGIRQAYRDFEERHDQSVILQRMCEEYRIPEGNHRALIEKLRELAIGKEDLKKDIARFAPEVCAAAERGDIDAQNLVKEEAEDLANVTAIALRRTFKRDELERGVRLVQCGSVLGNSFYQSSFEAQLEIRLLAPSERPAIVNWERVSTGVESCVILARSLSEGATYVDLDWLFRPALVQFDA